MEFRTKWELLEYLGQDKKYVRLIDRMIVKGEVEIVDWMYVYNKVDDSRDTVKWLEDEVKKLKEENDILKARVHELEEACKESLFGDNDTAKWDTAKWDIEKELEELKVNYEYLHNKFQRLKKGYDLVIDLTYGYIRPHYRIEKSEYKEQLAESINEKLDDMFWRDD
jgi:predicted RNase H-like nuclease (RuvC/YqgF family)